MDRTHTDADYTHGTGCFEHYPNLKPLDASLKNVGRLHDWLYFYDRLNYRVSSEQEFELLGYVPYAVVPWHHHMAAPVNSQSPVEYPKADYEVRILWEFAMRRCCLIVTLPCIAGSVTSHRRRTRRWQRR
jgi:hypothetical protein